MSSINRCFVLLAVRNRFRTAELSPCPRSFSVDGIRTLSTEPCFSYHTDGRPLKLQSHYAILVKPPNRRRRRIRWQLTQAGRPIDQELQERFRDSVRRPVRLGAEARPRCGNVRPIRPAADFMSLYRVVQSRLNSGIAEISVGLRPLSNLNAKQSHARAKSLGSRWASRSSTPRHFR